jgi:hypothetical protein
VSESNEQSGAGEEARASADTAEHDALPVLAGTAKSVHSFPPSSHLAPTRGAALAAIPAVQAAAMAAGGFVAGAAVVGLASRRSANAATSGRRSGRRLGRGRRTQPGSRAGELVQIVGSRSLLVDVHLLGGPSGFRAGR